jgi:hypothetical protein
MHWKTCCQPFDKQQKIISQQLPIAWTVAMAMFPRVLGAPWQTFLLRGQLMTPGDLGSKRQCHPYSIKWWLPLPLQTPPDRPNPCPKYCPIWMTHFGQLAHKSTSVLSFTLIFHWLYSNVTPNSKIQTVSQTSLSEACSDKAIYMTLGWQQKIILALSSVNCVNLFMKTLLILLHWNEISMFLYSVYKLNFTDTTDVFVMWHGEYCCYHGNNACNLMTVISLLFHASMAKCDVLTIKISMYVRI